MSVSLFFSYIKNYNVFKQGKQLTMLVLVNYMSRSYFNESHIFSSGFVEGGKCSLG